MSDDRYDKVLFGDSGASQKTVTKMTREALQEAERRLGYTLTITQGSFNTSVKASAKTHFGGGVVDLTAYDHERKVRVLREIGFAAWYRPASSSWPAHIHAVLIGDESAHQQAKDQVASYRRHRDGLAYDRPDPTWHPDPIKAYVYKGTKPKPPTPPKPQPQPVGHQVIFGHQSGLFDATDDEWRHGVNQLVARGATSISLTETRRRGLLSQITPAGWGWARLDQQRGMNECALLWRSSVWTPASPVYGVQLTDKTYHRQGGAEAAPLYGLVQPLQHVMSKKVVLRAALHLPSNIQGNADDVIEGPRPEVDPRELVTEDAIKNIGRLWDEGRSRHPDAARALGADFNLDWRKDFVREWWDETFPMLTASFEGRATKRGTHGNRVIDWHALSPHFAITGAEVLPATSGLDHKAVLTKAKLLKEKR